MQPFTGPPLVLAVSVPPLSSAASCTVQLPTCSWLSYSASKSQFIFQSFGNRPQLVAAAHVERRKSAFFSCSFTQRKVGAFSLRVRSSWLQFVGGELALFGLRLFSWADSGLVRGDYYQEQLISEVNTWCM